MAGQQFEYAFDDIGNRNSTKAGGDSTGANLRSASYTANTLNQITQRDVPGYVNIVGAASATATNVNVNNTLANRKGEYYRVELPTNNGSAAVWLGVTNRVVQNGTTNTVTGNVFLPQTPEVFSHDADGNLTNDGHWAYVWDAENRLTRMVAPTAIPTGARYALNFTNDWRGRRTSKVVSNWTGSAWSKSYEHKFVYDGWNLVATLDAANTLLYSFQWGTDLSGSMQGAGGVGGLVSMTVHSGASAGTYFYAYDGNGNVAALINAADGTIAARYEYGPFGELIRATGPLAFLNPFRFSTKYQDDETGFLYYGFRYYDPSNGRWLSRDPIGEKSFRVHTLGEAQGIDDELGSLSGNGEAAGLWPYGFVGNNPVNWVDILGLTVHLAPWNGEAANHSKQATANIQGDGLMLIATYKDGTEKSFRPWSNGEFNTEIGNRSVASYRTLEFSSTHGLGPGKNMQQEWRDGATWIVDSDFLTGATLPVYEDAQCTRRAVLPVKIGWNTLHIYDCPIRTCANGVYYTK